MATKYFEPKALTVAQVTTVTVGGTLAGETFTFSVGGVSIATHTDADTVIATTVAALVSAWNASIHTYATGITAVDASPDIILTGDTGGGAGGGSESGSSFILTLNTPGGSATLTQAETTSATSVNNFNDPVNFSDGTLPGAGDTVIIASSDVNICWGLESLTATGLTVKIEQSYTGTIGLRTSQFAANVAGDVYDTNAPEYRPTYLQLDMLTAEIGRNIGTGSPAGSPRIKLDNGKAGVSTTTIYDTSAISAEANLPSVRLKFASTTADVYCQSTQSGGAGICVDTPGETSNLGDIYIDGANTKFNTGSGTTFLNWTQHQGTCVMGAAATVTTVERRGGILTVNDDVVLTNLVDRNAGMTVLNGIATYVTASTGGYIDGTKSGISRTWSNVTAITGNIKVDFDVVTITNIVKPTNGKYEFGFVKAD